MRPGEVVFEIGAGAGRLTGPLARSAGSVIAVELDPRLADGLRRRFGPDPRVSVVEGDVLLVPLPTEPFRAFGNVPFGRTTAILRRLLDDPTTVMTRADLLIQYEAARKRASVHPPSLLTIGWLPWWELRIARRVPRRGFDPAPSVDAGMLVAVRRRRPLVAPADRAAFVALVGAAYRHPVRPIRRALGARLPGRSWTRLASQRGLSMDGTAADLDVFDWADVFRIVRK